MMIGATISLLEDLGMAPHEVLEEQPVLQQCRDEDVLLQDPRPR